MVSETDMVKKVLSWNVTISRDSELPILHDLLFFYGAFYRPFEVMKKPTCIPKRQLIQKGVQLLMCL